MEGNTRTSFALSLDNLCLLESGIDLLVDGIESLLRLLEAVLEGIHARLHLSNPKHFQKWYEMEMKYPKLMFILCLPPFWRCCHVASKVIGVLFCCVVFLHPFMVGQWSRWRGEVLFSVCRRTKVCWKTSEVYTACTQPRVTLSPLDKGMGIGFIVAVLLYELFGLYWSLNVDRLLRPHGGGRGDSSLYHGTHHGRSGVVVGRRKRWFWAENLFS